jgi:hypothetical protein
MKRRRVMLLLSLSLAVAFSPSGAQPPADPQAPAESGLSVAIAGGRMTAAIADAPLLAVLEALSSRTRISIVPGTGLEDERLSATINGEPVLDAIRRLLKDYDTFFYFSPSPQQSPALPAAIWVYPKGAGALLRPVPPETWAGSRELEMALRDKEPAVREKAYEVLMSRPDATSHNLVILAIRGASENDVELRQRLFSTASSKGIKLPIDVLADLVRADSSEEIRMMALDALAGEPDARAIATGALTDPSEVVRERAKDMLAVLDSMARRRDR